MEIPDNWSEIRDDLIANFIVLDLVIHHRTRTTDNMGAK